ncbi:hypothetical protein AB0K00_47530 [Dactylosporangium sp. NPDC049525]|uniref:hypothetical protein n=1 Tax=Dactylosporangium sp. NPDC049525 TaxID=3154730 RepID=UPI0034282E0C
MTATVELGEITCPSGELVLMDGGYLRLWSGDRPPEQEGEADVPPGVDYEIVGPDADAAARSFDRQWGRTVYDIPRRSAAEFVGLFDEHCREHGHDASLRPFAGQVPHRDRARRAAAAGDPGFIVSGVPVAVVGGVPADRPLRVTAEPGDDYGWRHIRIEAGPGPVAHRRELASIGVDHARFVFADAGALDEWVHDLPIDGLADVVFWGRDQDALADELGAPRAGQDGFGWLDLPVADAYPRALDLERRRDDPAGPKFNFDFRPHSHHWQVMAGVRAAEHEAATIPVGGAEVMFAMTSVGDGFFPVHAELDADGALVAVQISIDAE